MPGPTKPSKKTSAALSLLREKKMDRFAWIVIVLFALTFFALEITFLSVLTGKAKAAFFFEFNGVALSMFGALWTALGARVLPTEKQAMLDIKNNSGLVLTEVIHNAHVTSRFATGGAYFIMVGGAFLGIKVAFF